MKNKGSNLKLKKRTKVFFGIIISIALIIALGVTNIVPYFAVIPDMVKVGVDYITLNKDKNAITQEEIKLEFKNCNKENHPFILADKNSFDKIRIAKSTNSLDSYAKALYSSVIDNANALLDKSVYPVLEYTLDEEDSILPISREVINRIIILGFAWQLTDDEKYAKRGLEELLNVCSYDDWCPSHFLATAEMALAVSIGYDWFFDYLNTEQKTLLCDTTWEYAINHGLDDNHWFTWSKNNWNSICYSGLGIASMTFFEKDPNRASEFLSMCYKNMPIAFSNFTPDGVYAEGPGYCQSGMNAIVNFIATSQNLFGSDFGMSEIAGFKELGYFPVYITTPTGMFNFGDNKPEQCYSPVLHWYAREFNAPLLTVYQKNNTPKKFTVNTSENTERNGTGKENALSLLWYESNLDTQKATLGNEPLSRYLKSDSGQTLVLMRSSYLDKNATFAGIKGGYNFINHGDLDIGTFVFDSMGERWAEELGPASYDAPNYFLNTPAGGRWKNYAKRAEGQNTLVINPDMTLDDQYVLAECDFENFKETKNGGKAKLNMTDAYRMNGATAVTREFELYNNYSSLKITDSITCLIPSEIYWFMHTKAEIEITQNKKAAILTINEKQMKVTLSGDGEFSVMNAEALKGKYEYDEEYSDIKKLTIRLDGVKKAKIIVDFEPIK